MKGLPNEIKERLDELELSYSLVAGGRHIKLMIENRLIAVIRRGSTADIGSKGHWLRIDIRKNLRRHFNVEYERDRPSASVPSQRGREARILH